MKRMKRLMTAAVKRRNDTKRWRLSSGGGTEEGSHGNGHQWDGVKSYVPGAIRGTFQIFASALPTTHLSVCFSFY